MLPLLAASLAAALVLVAPQSSGANPAYCSPSGDYCQYVDGSKQRPVFNLRAFSLTDEIDVCVMSRTKEWTCHSFPMRRGEHGIFVSKVRWHKHFPRDGRGSYRVAWRWNGYKLGKTLKFSVR